MQFNSYIFIMVFLPCMIVGYFLLHKINHYLGKIFLLAMCLTFYAYGGLDVTIILGCSLLFNYIFSVLIKKVKVAGKFWLFLDVLANVGMLFYFKYFNFTLNILNESLHKNYVLQNIILPLGISFFTFQQIMYVVAVYRDELENINILDYLIYILYFPKIIMGPLADPAKLIQQINDKELKKINWDNMANGLKTFSFGLFKKVVIADTFAIAVNWAFGNVENITSMEWMLVILFYTFQIYFDFSGYSDMAVAISLMLNIELPMNFDSPYKAISIRDFWKRWHMSLTGFFTKYIYFSLGGSKKGKFRTYLNTMIIFLISGIWHGANWTFILWGVLHGFFSITDRILSKWKNNIIDAAKWIETFFIVNVLWLLFRAESISQWIFIMKKMFCFTDTSISQELLDCFNLAEIKMLYLVPYFNHLNMTVRGLSMLIFILLAFVICLVPENNIRKLKHNNWFLMIVSAFVFVWSFLCLSGEAIFVYFNF